MIPARYLMAATLMLAACGGGRSNEMPTRAAFANGPIQVACQTGGRSEANPALCRCIQFVANQSLSGGDQRMAVDFFKDPHRAQEIRQSDNPRHEEFWKRYRSFADASEGLCSPYR